MLSQIDTVALAEGARVSAERAVVTREVRWGAGQEQGRGAMMSQWRQTARRPLVRLA